MNPQRQENINLDASFPPLDSCEEDEGVDVRSDHLPARRPRVHEQTDDPTVEGGEEEPEEEGEEEDSLADHEEERGTESTMVLLCF